jgi:hypothetical protein
LLYEAGEHFGKKIGNPGKFKYVVLGKVGEDQLDRSTYTLLRNCLLKHVIEGEEYNRHEDEEEDVSSY